jgi:hypothetical protein
MRTYIVAALDFFFLVMSDVEEWPAVDVRALESSSSLAYEVGSWMDERNGTGISRQEK